MNQTRSNPDRRSLLHGGVGQYRNGGFGISAAIDMVRNLVVLWLLCSPSVFCCCSVCPCCCSSCQGLVSVCLSTRRGQTTRFGTTKKQPTWAKDVMLQVICIPTLWTESSRCQHTHSSPATQAKSYGSKSDGWIGVGTVNLSISFSNSTNTHTHARKSMSLSSKP